MITEEQQAVIETSKRMQPQETLKIEACAGSGKTSAFIEIATYIHLSFNNLHLKKTDKAFG